MIAFGTKLECNHDSKFRILQFTDTHFGESHISNYMTTSMMNNILDAEKPDLVVLSGDNISGYTWTGKKGWFEHLWLQLVSPMIKRNIPWIFTPGNHDAEGEWNRSQIIEHDINTYSNAGSLTQIGYMDTKSGQNIYFVDIFNKNVAATRIWMIDSGMKDCNNDYDYMGCLQTSQIEWYLKQSHDIPGIIYMHIPPVQLLTYYNSSKYPIIGDWNYTVDNMNCFDETNLNNKRFIDDYLLKNNDIIAMFHGHQHLYDWLLLYENDLLLGFGRKSGEGWMIGVDIDFVKISGVRVFELDCNNPKQWKTWIRDKYMNMIQVTSFDEMRKQKISGKDSDDDVCEENCNNEIQCLSARYWEGWKPNVEQKFKHWLTPFLIDIVDVVCRSRLVWFVDNYILDLGMSEQS